MFWNKKKPQAKNPLPQEEPEDLRVAVLDYTGEPVYMKASQVPAFEARQKQILEEIERGERWDERKGPSPERQKQIEKMNAEYLAWKAAKQAEQK